MLGEALILGLVTYRVWALLGRDVITEPARERLYAKTPPWVAVLLGCVWCAGTWVAGILTLTATLTGVVSGTWWVLWAASATVAGVIGEWVERRE